MSNGLVEDAGAGWVTLTWCRGGTLGAQRGVASLLYTNVGRPGSRMGSPDASRRVRGGGGMWWKRRTSG